MKTFFTAFIVMFFSLSIPAQNMKVNQSEIKWKAYKALNADAFSHYGTIKLKAGNIVLNKDGEVTGGNFIIDMNTIVADDMAGNPKQKKYLENHLKSDDFFDVEKYPTVFFKITSVKKIADAYNAMVTGNLTIKKTTRKISFPANIKTVNNSVSVETPVFTFNRKDFGLNYNVFEDMILKNDVEVSVKFTAR